MLIMISPNGSDAVICVPYNKIYNIKFESKTVSVVYDGGGIIEVNESFQKVVEIAKVTYENEESLKKVIKQFYDAIKKKESLFYFGGLKSKKKSQVEFEIVDVKERDENWLLDTISN